MAKNDKWNGEADPIGDVVFERIMQLYNMGKVEKPIHYQTIDNELLIEDMVSIVELCWNLDMSLKQLMDKVYDKIVGIENEH